MKADKVLEAVMGALCATVLRPVVYFDAERNYIHPPGFWGTVKGILVSNQKKVM